MQIDAQSVVYTVMENMEKTFESIDWLLADLDVPEEYEQDLKTAMQEIKASAYNYVKPVELNS